MSESETTILLAVETLKEFTVLKDVANQQCPKRVSAFEAHPRAVLSTKQKDDSTVCSSPCDATPVNPTARILSAQVVASPRCRVTRQPSTPVDLPPAQDNHSQTRDDECLVSEQVRPCSSRPGSLGFRRDLSNSSSGSGIPTPCPAATSPDRQLGASYPPGPMQCYQASPQPQEEYSVSC